MQKINPNLAIQARQVLDVNKAERHLRGGLATRDKYLSLTPNSKSNNSPYKQSF